MDDASNRSKSFDVIIVGGGPSGSAAAMALRESQLSVALVDRAAFPRDKICGDALSVDVVNQLGRLSPSLPDAFNAVSEKTASHGVRIAAPNARTIDIPFQIHNHTMHGYVCRRRDFDALLFREAAAMSHVVTFEDCAVNTVVRKDDGVRLETSRGPIRGRMLVGADGAQSVVRRTLMDSRIDPRHYSGGVRIYHGNVAGFNTGNFIELHFMREILPGYLWVFPLPNGHANVGIGMLSSAVSRRRVNLSRELQRLLREHPAFIDRFGASRIEEQPRGYGLPLGGAWKKISGDRFLLTGDAASLIDPFSGEGIGNAIRSGRFAADQIRQCFIKKRFDAEEMSNYDARMRKALSREFQVSYMLLRLSKYPWLLNTVVNKANRNAMLHNTLIDALAFPEKKAWLTSPAFYFNLIFRS